MKNNQNSKQDKIFKAIPDWERRGISICAYCREMNIPYETFLYWLKKYRKMKLDSVPVSGGSFLPVSVSSPKGSEYLGQERIRITYSGGIQVECPKNISVDQLRALVQ